MVTQVIVIGIGEDRERSQEKWNRKAKRNLTEVEAEVVIERKVRMGKNQDEAEVGIGKMGKMVRKKKGVVEAETERMERVEKRKKGEVAVGIEKMMKEVKKENEEVEVGTGRMEKMEKNEKGEVEVDTERMVKKKVNVKVVAVVNQEVEMI